MFALKAFSLVSLIASTLGPLTIATAQETRRTDVKGISTGMSVEQALEQARSRGFVCSETAGLPKNRGWDCKTDDEEFKFLFSWALEPKRLEDFSFIYKTTASYQAVVQQLEKVFGVQFPRNGSGDRDGRPARMADGSWIDTMPGGTGRQGIRIVNEKLMILDEEAKAAKQRAVPLPDFK